MPYVAPMPNPDMVTGPDWTTLLGSVALGLTKGVGEGAEIIQRDRAQRMAEQNAAKEQAFRDRQLDLEMAYRKDRLAWEKEQAQKNIDAQNQRALWATYARLAAKNPALAATFANENGLPVSESDAAGGAPLRATADTMSAYSGAPVATGVDDSGNAIENVSDSPPTELAPPDWYDNPKTKYKPNIPIEGVEATAEIDPYGGVYSGNVLKGYTDPYAPGFYDRQKQAWDAKETKTASSNLDYSPRQYPYQKPERIVTKTKSPWEDGYNEPPAQQPQVRQQPTPQTPQQGTGGDRPPKTLPIDALAGLDQPTQKLVLRAAAGDAVAYADLKRNRPGLVEQIMQKRKPK
jgi:hypothetical protein